MCFSASASFGSGIVLSLMGMATLRKASVPSQIPIAVFPFIFAVQQFAEGIVWISLLNPQLAGMQAFAVYAFLSFSHVIWPMLMPLSILLLEKERVRRNILWLLLSAGVALALYHIFALFNYPVSTRIDQHHVQYFIQQQPRMRLPANMLYGLAAILPAFVSSLRRMWWLGMFLFISYTATYLFFHIYVVSVWCYFAAFISILIYLLLSDIRTVSPVGGLSSKIANKGV
jgi:hypothetical protein